MERCTSFVLLCCPWGCLILFGRILSAWTGDITVITLRKCGNIDEVTHFGSETEVVTVGRTPSNQFAIDDETVSRQHARLVRQNGSYYLEDLNSLNGSYLNHRRVRRERITHGDRLNFGAISYIADLGTGLPIDGKLTSPLTIAGHELRREIGRGGMAVVYYGIDKAGREVAFKLPRVGSSSPELKQFKREISLNRRLGQHPNLLESYSHGDHNGRPWLAMEYSAGVTLRRLLIRAQRAFSTAFAKIILKQVAVGLGYLHSAGIVHCDLKPENILVNLDLSLKLFDLGIAEYSGEISGNHQGTPYAMSPEQCGSGRLDHRSDIYALGLLAYELLTGHIPFSGNDDELRAHQRSTPPVAPSELNPKLDETTEAFILCLLNKSPEERPQTMIEVASLLDDLPEEDGSEDFRYAVNYINAARLEEIIGSSEQSTIDKSSSPAEGAIGGLYLDFLSGIRTGQRYILPAGGAYLLGRGDNASIPLGDSYASHQHAELYVDRFGAELFDLESANGICLNGQAVAGSSALSHGAVFIIGNTVFRASFFGVE